MLKKIKIIFIFFYDLINSKKNDLTINKNTSYQLMRTLYRISNGLFTNIIGYLVSGINYKNSNKFKNGYLDLELINQNEISIIKNEVSKICVDDTIEFFWFCIAIYLFQ